MSDLFYVDYFLPATKKIEEIIFKVPPFWENSFKSLDELLTNLRSDNMGWDEVAVGDRTLNMEILTDLVSNFLNTTKIDPSRISYMISTDPLNFESNSEIQIPFYIKEKFGMEKACIFSLSHQCGASCSCFGVADSLLCKKGDYIIVLSNNSIGTKDRLGPGLMNGDGSSILVFTNEPSGFEVIDFDSVSSGLLSYEKFTKKVNPDPLLLRSHKEFIAFLKEFIANNSIQPTDVDAVIVQPTSRWIYENTYSKALEIPIEKFYLENISKGGHLGNVDIARNLKDYTEKVDPPSQSIILVFSFSFIASSSDFTFNAALLKRR